MVKGDIVKHIALTTLALAVLTVMGCSNENSTMGAGQVKDEAKEAASATTQYLKQEKQQFVSSMQESLNDIKSNMNTLKEHAQAAGGKANAQLGQHIELFEDKMNLAQAQLDHLKDSSGKAWMDMKLGMQEAVADLKQSYNRVLTEFNDRS